jgi:hypothetical protein
VKPPPPPLGAAGKSASRQSTLFGLLPGTANDKATKGRKRKSSVGESDRQQVAAAKQAGKGKAPTQGGEEPSVEGEGGSGGDVLRESPAAAEDSTTADDVQDTEEAAALDETQVEETQEEVCLSPAARDVGQLC